MTAPLSSRFDPTVRKLPMRLAEGMTVELGGTVRRNGSAELVFAHWWLSYKVVTKSTRREASDKLMTWLRQLIAARRAFREALGFPEA